MVLSEIDMLLRDESGVGIACLQYSWVPEGRRRSVGVPVGEMQSTARDEVDVELNVSFVEVYVLNVPDGSIGHWQFPDVAAGRRIVRASVVLSDVTWDGTPRTVTGTAYFSDGSEAASTRELEAGVFRQ